MGSPSSAGRPRDVPTKTPRTAPPPPATELEKISQELRRLRTTHDHATKELETRLSVEIGKLDHNHADEHLITEQREQIQAQTERLILVETLFGRIRAAFEPWERREMSDREYGNICADAIKEWPG